MMNQHGLKRILALLLACLMMMGCFAYATEEMEAAAQEQTLAVEETPNDDAAGEPDAQQPNDVEAEGTTVEANPQQDEDTSTDAVPAEEEGEAAAEDEAVVEDMAVVSNESCVHAHTDSYQYMQNAEYTPVDDKYHETCGYLVTVVYCDDCG